MLRFNSSRVRAVTDILVFQYILCYGSTSHIYISSLFLSNFNTSYVTVQLIIQKKQTIFRFISIHPMLRFNGTKQGSHKAQGKISIHPMLRFNWVHEWYFSLFPKISIHPMLRFNLGLIG